MPRMGRVPNENRGRNQKPVPVIPLGADKGLSDDDKQFAKADPDISVFVMHGDGNVYGGYYSSKRNGIDLWIHNNPVSINSLINGKTTLKIIADFYKNK